MSAPPLLPDDLWTFIAPLLPPRPPKPRGGRLRIPDRRTLTGILFVLKTGRPWHALPKEPGCGSGSTCWRRLHRLLLDRLGSRGRIDWSRAALDSASSPAKRGGEETGPNPTDRGRPGTKRHLLVDRNGIPFAVLLSPANRHDSRMVESLLEAVQPIKGLWGRPRKRPAKLHADKAYDFAHCRNACRIRGITPRIARRGMESSEKFGRYRWVVERTLAWLARYRRLTVHYERLAELHLAFLTLACALICWRFLRRP